jgi:hypothetical protein
MIEETMDYTTWITARYVNSEGIDVVEYQNTDGKRWRISNNCIACGLCEMRPEGNNNTVIHTNYYIDENNQRQSYTRTLIWYGEPGTPGACVESDYEARKDIPVTPDFTQEIPECTLVGEWLEDAN